MINKTEFAVATTAKIAPWAAAFSDGLPRLLLMGISALSLLLWIGLSSEMKNKDCKQNSRKLAGRNCYSGTHVNCKL